MEKENRMPSLDLENPNLESIKTELAKKKLEEEKAKKPNKYESKSYNNTMNWILPAIAAAEAIGTSVLSKGRAKSENPVALQAMDKLQQFKKDDEEAKRNALGMKVQEKQLAEIDRKSGIDEEKETRLKAYRAKLGIPDADTKTAAIDVVKQEDPNAYLDYISKQEATNASAEERRLARELAANKEIKGDKAEKFTQSGLLRKEYATESKSYEAIRDSYSRYNGIIEKNKGVSNPASDIALMYSYMKALDPTSTVRESEYATVNNAGGVPSAIQSAWNKLLGTGQMSVAMRSQIEGTMEGAYQDQLNKQYERQSQFQDIAKEWGLQPEIITKHIKIDPIVSKKKPKLNDFVE